MELSVVPIHKHPKYLLDCCQLINSEWKRSETARLHGLESSSDKLPTSLILLKDNKVIGHIKLSTIPSIPEGCFVESVVIDSKLRGKGYGTILMEKAEEYCKHVLNIVTIYLSTKGQEQFYNKLGYSECSPISIYGSYVPKTIAPQCVLDNSDNQKNGTVKNAPPPPPLPTNTSTTSIKTFMKKEL